MKKLCVLTVLRCNNFSCPVSLNKHFWGNLFKFRFSKCFQSTSSTPAHPQHCFAISGTLKHWSKKEEKMPTPPSFSQSQDGWALTSPCNSCPGACPAAAQSDFHWPFYPGMGCTWLGHFQQPHCLWLRHFCCLWLCLNKRMVACFCLLQDRDRKKWAKKKFQRQCH